MMKNFVTTIILCLLTSGIAYGVQPTMSYIQYEDIIAKEQQIRSRQWQRSAMAFLMGMHQRAGRNSPIQLASPDAIQYIVYLLRPKPNCYSYEGMKRIFVNVNIIKNYDYARNIHIAVNIPLLPTLVTYGDLVEFLKNLYPFELGIIGLGSEDFSFSGKLADARIDDSSEEKPLCASLEMNQSIRRFFV